MGWTEKKAINRIFNTFKRAKDKIYQEDVDALKVLNEFNEEQSKKFVEGNLVFAKLYAIALRQNLNYYGGIKMAIKGINSELSKPLDYHLQLFTKELNDNDFLNYIESIGGKMLLESDNTHLLSEHQNEIKERLLTNWTKENVEKSFFKSANDVLKEINNYS